MKAAAPANLPRHFYSLDALRGVAALGVVFFHWRQFFYRGTVDTFASMDRFPFSTLLHPFYLMGHRAVDLFFCLSGFIFFWLYSGRIRERTIGLREFWVLRFSRLYPLHFVTLLAVAALQRFSLARHGTFQIFEVNNLYHFVLQLGFASNWGFQQDYSFNAPVWSVSVEIMLYAVFFLVCAVKFNRPWQLVLLAAGGFAFMRFGIWEIGRGLFSFFIGGLAFALFLRLRAARPSRRALQMLAGALVLLWVLLPLEAADHALHRWWTGHFARSVLALHGRDPIGLLLQKLSEFSFELCLFPATLVTLSLWESERGTLGRRLRWLGNISYSSYLLHVPLQIAFLLATAALGIGRDFFFTRFSLLLYFGLLIALSLASYEYFERPCQSWLRAWLLPARAKG